MLVLVGVAAVAGFGLDNGDVVVVGDGEDLGSGLAG